MQDTTTCNWILGSGNSGWHRAQYKSGRNANCQLVSWNMALLASDDAIRSFDVATSLLIQCRMAHEQLQAAGSKEEKLLNRNLAGWGNMEIWSTWTFWDEYVFFRNLQWGLCRELQSLRNQVPESFEITRDDSEVDSFPMPIHLEQASHDSNRIVKDNSRRSSVHSTESRASRFKRRNSRNMTFDVESDPVTHSYSINGITRKDGPAFHPVRKKQQHEDNNSPKYNAKFAWF